ncbi:hypothetical protein T05_13459 [Trichinella murrelli]|uniref:Uncharacterized protein n=1 Tax=Trichinella murrelli TaxID=144512 RepID=A0A0V0U510_9BILA|nr:hypothetical protein T05_13459 [Trichinella murrelli]
MKLLCTNVKQIFQDDIHGHMRTSGGGGGGGDVVQHTMKRKALRRMKPASLFDFQMTKGNTDRNPTCQYIGQAEAKAKQA